MNIFVALTVLFVGLKLTHYIDWSWWLISLPILAPIGLSILILIIVVIADRVMTIMHNRK
jgi:hypothetical protein